MENQLRCFIAVKPPENIIFKVLEIKRELEKKFNNNFVRWCTQEQMHLTLKFLGNVIETDIDKLKQALRSSCENFHQFELSICGIGCFPTFNSPRVIWLGMNGEIDKLKSLQESVEIAVCEFGDNKEEREFKPHLTLARIKNAPRREVINISNNLKQIAGQIGLVGIWQVTEVLLMQSILQPSGAVYKELDRIDLQSKP